MRPSMGFLRRKASRCVSVSGHWEHFEMVSVFFHPPRSLHFSAARHLHASVHMIYALKSEPKPEVDK